MIRRPLRVTRAGYTLLEVLLAAVIAALLLAALYAALDITLLRMDASRDSIVSNDLARAVANRLSADLTSTLSPLPPKSGGDGSTATDQGSALTAASSGGVAATIPTGTASGSAGSSSGGSSPAAPASPSGSSGDSTGSSSSNSTTPAAAMLPLGMGVVGTDSQLTIFCSRVPSALTDAEAVNTQALLPGDQRKVVYYLASDGSGLCRQERPWVTADGVGNSTDADRSDEAADVIAPEVKAVVFEYFDGSSWATAWDGAVAEGDGTTLTGPPRAIRVTLTLEIPGRAGAVTEKTVVHTVAVRGGSGSYRPGAAGATPADSTGGGTTSGTSGSSN